MAYDIRRLSFAEVLDRAFRVLLDNFVVLVAVAAIFLVPFAVLNALFVRSGMVRSPAVGAIYGLFILLVLAMVAPLNHAALTTAVTDIYLDKRVTPMGAYRDAWKIGRSWEHISSFCFWSLAPGLSSAE